MSAVFLGDYIVDATLIVKPVNTVALVGTSVQLNCRTDQSGSPGRIVWSLRKPDTTGVVIVNWNCKPNPSYPQYSVNSHSAGRCDLVINNASLELAARYWCYDDDDFPDHRADAELTVVGE